MVSVTQRIKQIKQPYGGYLPVRKFDSVTLDDYAADIGTLYPSENLHGSIVGLVVDYLSRVFMGADLVQAFAVSLNGAQEVGELDYAVELLSGMTHLNDDQTIHNACQVVAYDQIWRGAVHPSEFKGVRHIRPDAATIHNIRVLVYRTLLFLEQYGPLVSDGFTFEGGYTDTVDTGDGDFLTRDTLWDLKVIRGAITSKHSLQLLMYYLMGKHSVHTIFTPVTHIGIFNPRMNLARRFDMRTLSPEVLDAVTTDVLGFPRL